MKNAFKRSQELLDLEMKTDEQLQMQQTSETENSEIIANHSMSSMQQRTIQVVVKIDQAEDMISKGWRLVATLPGEKAVFEIFGAESEICNPQ